MEVLVPASTTLRKGKRTIRRKTGLTAACPQNKKGEHDSVIRFNIINKWEQ